jgi:two-component system response regulator AlgR
MRVVIADDEPLARQRLRTLLAVQADVVVVAEAANGEAALDACAEHAPDLLLLDIAMPGLDGLEAARRLARLDPRPALVFCTALERHALDAFESQALDYLLKPIRAERLAAALARVRTWLAGRERTAHDGARRSLIARTPGRVRVIPLDEVYCLHADEKYVTVHHAGGEDVIDDTLKALEDEFPERFLRIHRNCLVARNELLELRRNGEGQVLARLRHVPGTFEVSRRALAGVREALGLGVGG